MMEHGACGTLSIVSNPNVQMYWNVNLNKLNQTNQKNKITVR